MFFDASFGRMYYEKTGQGEPLIMLHGNGESHEIFAQAVEVLKEHFTVYLPDTRGHGKSDRVDTLHYEDMAGDLREFITRNGLEKPVVYGFSDGGITALLLCIQNPSLIKHAIVSGVNVNPKGIKPFWLNLFRLIHFLKPSEEFALMLREPDITQEMLSAITEPVDILGGSRDMISGSHMKQIASAIPQGSYTELKGETHSSYVVGSRKIAELILERV